MLSSIGKLFCISGKSTLAPYSYTLMVVYLVSFAVFSLYALKARKHMRSTVSNPFIKIGMVVVAILGFTLAIVQGIDNMEPLPGSWMLDRFMLMLRASSVVLFPEGLYKKLLAGLQNVKDYQGMQAIAVSTGFIIFFCLGMFGLAFLDRIVVCFISLEKFRRPCAFFMLWIFLGVSLKVHIDSILYLQYRNRICSILPLRQPFLNLAVPDKDEDGVVLEQEADIQSVFSLMHVCMETSPAQSHIVRVMKSINLNTLWHTNFNLENFKSSESLENQKCQQWGMQCLEAVEKFCSSDFTEFILAIIGNLFVLVILQIIAIVLMLITYERFLDKGATETSIKISKKEKINLVVF